MSNDRKDRVFLSYASEDLDKVKHVYEGLIKRRLDVWFDKEHLVPGKWHPQIEDAIRQSRYFVICLSESAIKKIGYTQPGYQSEELKFAYEKAMSQPETEFTIVPTRITKLDEGARGGFQLNPFQQYDLFDDLEKGLDKLAVDMAGISLSDATARDERTYHAKFIDTLRDKAFTEYSAGRFGESIALFDTILALSAKDVKAWSSKGYALGKLGKYKDAIKAIDKALQIDPNDFIPWTNKGYALLCLKRNKEAIEAFNKALHINPDVFKARSGKGYALGMLGRYKEAIESLNKAIELNPDDTDAPKYRDGLMKQLKEND